MLVRIANSKRWVFTGDYKVGGEPPATAHEARRVFLKLWLGVALHPYVLPASMDDALGVGPWIDSPQVRVPSTRRIRWCLWQSGLSSCHDPTLLYRDTPGWRGPPVLALLGPRMFLVGKGWDHATALGLGVSMLG
ncbi:hypothetical protein FOIG_01089 [Fusarium odoratissimum NRRL 54006]|uniref:Uncharacterized protein n=1 Tax=Fusarium odoratissimum (strain NRRL 54006) TaxID=1089451 RepID=X0KCT7_FUSO5|nr:uncharacterized protein FOIG_01089 [Fusarium odoratissimum NRRL 54006]EXM11404.1 hypothetical protein FOIG_01089 [Fusarium odoratissimum NRRL 54006]